MNKNNKKKKWTSKRHLFICNAVRRFYLLSYRRKFNFTYDPIENKKEPHLILCNHQTGIDQFMICQAFKGLTYFVCTDDIMSIPIASNIIRWGVNPIPYKKASTDLTFLRTCRQVVKEGGSIMIFPEGNRTYRGKTEYINPTISKMIKFLNIPVDFLNLHGGFGAFPRFSDKSRKGKISLVLKRTLLPDEYKTLSDDELNNLINQELMVDEYQSNNLYLSKKKAEYIERVLYRCPKCGLSTFTSNKNMFWCNKCLDKYEYLDNLSFSANAPFKNLSDWYDFQTSTLLTNNISDYPNDKLFEDNVKILEVVPRKFKKALDQNGHVAFYKDHIELTIKNKIVNLPLTDILSSGVFGKNKVNLFLDNIIYQLKGDKRFNGLKYVHHIYKDKIERGTIQNEFLGI